MKKLPQNKASQYSDFGVHLRRIEFPESNHIPVAYVHQDDYYICGLLEEGTGCCIIDFKEQHFSSGNVFLIQPGQVHRFVHSKDAVGWVLLVDTSFVGCEAKRIFDRFQLFASSIKIDEQLTYELKQMASILADRLNDITDELSKTIVRGLAEAYINIVAESVKKMELQQVKHSHRHIEIVLSFLQLLAEHIATNHSPSYYASRLNISPVYLNEVVKKVTGMSTSSYIKNELILQAKRLLVHTNFSIKEISDRLGIEDYAYFSRIFTQTAGTSPSTFRRKNLE